MHNRNDWSGIARILFYTGSATWGKIIQTADWSCSRRRVINLAYSILSDWWGRGGRGVGKSLKIGTVRIWDCQLGNL
jgi:hypothetical protein